MVSLFLPRALRWACCLDRLRAWVCLCMGLAGFSSHAQQVLTLTQALRLAQDRSHQLQAHDAAATASREMAVAAAQRPDPTMKAGIDNLPVTGADRFSLTRDFMTMRSLGLAQELTRADKLQARSARFKREAQAAEAARAMALAQLRRDTAIAWLDCHYQARMQELLQLQRVEASLQVDAAEAAYRGGRGAQVDVWAARSALAGIDDRLRLVGQQAGTARIRLARWVGADAEQVLGSPPPLEAVRLDEVVLETQLLLHPQVAWTRAQEEIAQAEVELARSARRPDWSVELMLSQRGPAYSNMVSVNVSVPLLLDPRHRQDREVAARLALAAQMQAQREETLREVVADARSLLQQWHGGRDRLAHYGRELIPLAGGRTQAAMAAYRGGGGTLGAVLEARRMEIDTRIDRLRLEMETAAWWARLEYLLLPGSDAAAPAGKEARP